ncbi:MAG: hypothetical protein PVS2B1_13660 [Candidatus Dormibacteraceae bacterium]
MRDLQRLVVAGTAACLLVACGNSTTASLSSPTPTPTPTQTAATKLAANADACALVTPDDATLLLGQGQLKPGAAPTAEPIPGGVPTMTGGSTCYYHGLPYAGSKTAGLVQVFLVRFTTPAAAHDSFQQVLASLSSPSGPALKPVSGLGDEAYSASGPLPSPASGTASVIGVRKGSVAFVISAGVNTGYGPADFPGAVQSLAQKVTARL